MLYIRNTYHQVQIFSKFLYSPSRNMFSRFKYRIFVWLIFSNLFIYWIKAMMIITKIIMIIIILVVLTIIKLWLNHRITCDRLSNSSIFALSNTTVKNMIMFVNSLTEQVQFQFPLSISNKEKQFPYSNNYKLWHCLKR